MTNLKANAPQHGFSVATLLLLTVVVAIGAAAVRTIAVTPVVVQADGGALQGSAIAHAFRNAENSREEAAFRGVAGGVIGLLVGIGIGAGRPRPVAGVMLGILVGGSVGALAGAVLADPTNLPVAVIGSALLILLGVAVRVLSAHR